MVKYIYDGKISIIERDASDNTLAIYTKIPQAPGGIGGLVSTMSHELSATQYYHDSHLGNVNQITDTTGAVVQTYEYDAFGNITDQSGSLTQAYAYKTKEYSAETGLIFFGARYYNPLIGRFITEDPSGMVDGPNLYLYCNNDPVNRVDLWGLWSAPKPPLIHPILLKIPQYRGLYCHTSLELCQIYCTEEYGYCKDVSLKDCLNQCTAAYLKCAVTGSFSIEM